MAAEISEDYRSTVRQWEQGVRWHRRILARIGLQGKLMLCIMGLLCGALGGSCWLFISRSSRQINDLMGEQARQTAYALALASKPAMMSNQARELRRIGQDLIKSRNILFVAFLDAQARPLALASRDPDFDWSPLRELQRDPRILLQVHREVSPVFGYHMEVAAPVLVMESSGGSGEGRAAGASRVRLIGYAAVGLATTLEQARLRQVEYSIIAIGCLYVLMSLPLAYMMVRRIFQPIRQLVAATNSISQGHLDTQVAIHRPDLIGTLARSFNEMVKKVRGQQRELAGVNQDLERKVEQRTGELESANRRLTREIEEKEDFLRAVSHDLGAPLRNIDGMAAMLLKHRQTLGDDVVHRLERIQKNVEVETDLISELLELSRIKSRRQKLEMMESEAMVRELGGVFEADLRRKQIELFIETPLPVLYAERGRLRQVFQNLIDNAIKYMGEKSPREIRIGCQVRASEAEFYVRDTGLGIDPEDIDKVFYVFRRGKNSRDAQASGKGVGLASVKSIIETYNGSISVESRKGQGSTFRFTLNGRFLANATAGCQRMVGETEVQPASGTRREQEEVLI